MVTNLIETVTFVVYIDSMKEINVFDYTQPRQILLDYLSLRQKKDDKFSVRKWAQEMELKGHSLLIMLLQGKRSLRGKHVQFLKKGMNLNAIEEKYFLTLIQYEKAIDLEEKEFYVEILEDLHPEKNFESKKVDAFKIISNWYYMAILAMTQLKKFSGSEEEIFKRLNGKLSIHEIRSALTRLKEMDLLRTDENGKVQATYNRISTTDDITNEGARIYHRQVMDLAKEALTNQNIEDREFQSFTMAIDKQKIPLAKEMIRKFRAKLSKTVSGNGDYVYQTNIQFFQLTECLVNKHEDEGVRRIQ
ncbi:MAG: hypothetical protein A2577_01185 [Bdellovibrionales bacterium RIFOXYD1_FULL_36_51]|nr:MAG: hypothetical protein A2577_01185 [Bdellovibrionales bacterium RIFOXYD1_FULL_36_51]